MISEPNNKLTLSVVKRGRQFVGIHVHLKNKNIFFTDYKFINEYQHLPFGAPIQPKRIAN